MILMKIRAKCYIKNLFSLINVTNNFMSPDKLKFVRMTPSFTALIERIIYA